MGSSGNAAERRVVLAVNGARYEAAGVELSMSLLEYLRTRTTVRGPKLGCGEGEPPPNRYCLIIAISTFSLALFYSLRSDYRGRHHMHVNIRQECASIF
jgi:hypothetical protein